MQLPLRALLVALLVLTGLAAVPAAATAQGWESYTATDLGLRFSIPERWTTEIEEDEGVAVLTSTSPREDMALVVLAFDDGATLAIGDILDAIIEDEDFELEGEIEEEEEDGATIATGYATGELNGRPVAIILMGLAIEDRRFAAYVFVDADRFEQNEKTLERILESIEAIE